ncbi:MAG: HEAT repeat domain-containing protein [Planctomycetes bacterium]|nr:HEAT repeat domain-containing protein [Planctomycetota bacterium]
MKTRIVSVLILCVTAIYFLTDYSNANCPSGGSGGNTITPITPQVPPAPTRPPANTGLEPLVFNPPNTGPLGAWEMWWIRNRLKHLPFKEPLVWREEVNAGENETIAQKMNQTKEIIDAIANAMKSDKFPLARGMAAWALGKFKDKYGLQYLKEALNDPDYNVKNMAYLSLGVFGDVSSFDTIKQFLFSSESTDITKAYAALALGYIKDPKSTEALKEILNPNSKTPQNAMCSAILALGNLQEKESIPLLSGILNDQKRTMQERAYAALALGRIKAPESLPELKKSMQDKTGDIRSSVAIALGLIKSPDSKNDLLNMLQNDKDSRVRQFAAVSLAQLGDKSVCDALRKMLTDKKLDYNVKGVVIIALGIMGDEKSADLLRETVSSKKDPFLRPASIIGLGLLKDKKAVPVLINTLKTEQMSDPVAFLYTVQALGMIGDEQAVPTLETLYKKAQEDLNIAVPVYNNLTVALAMLGKRKEVLEILHKHLKDKKATSQILLRAIHGTAYVGTKESVTNLINCYKDEKNQDVRMYIMFALGFILDPQKINPLYDITADNNYFIWLNIMDHISLNKPD